MSTQTLTAAPQETIEQTVREGARAHLAYIVYFRAAAIVLIVAGHCQLLAGLEFTSLWDYHLSALTTGATALFVFISGFLFDYVYAEKYAYWTFIVEKVRRLVPPYLLLTIVATLLFPDGPANSMGERLVSNLLLGKALGSYWYIPFILLMFALAPLHRIFMKLSVAQQQAIIVVTLIMACIVQRPIRNTNVLQSVIFFMPIYLCGIFLSMNRHRLMPPLREAVPVFLIITLVCITIQSLSGHKSNMHKSLFVIHGFEVMGIQKLALSLALIGLCSRLPSPAPRIVAVIADTSFAIFFIHHMLVRGLRDTGIFQITHWQWLDLTIATVVIVATCLLIALGARRLLKSNSKYLIGY